jgi:hypothetical protein
LEKLYWEIVILPIDSCNDIYDDNVDIFVIAIHGGKYKTYGFSTVSHMHIYPE